MYVSWVIVFHFKAYIRTHRIGSLPSKSRDTGRIVYPTIACRKGEICYDGGMETRKERTRRKPGPVPGPPTKKYNLLLEETLAEWGKRQPGGLSQLLRRLLKEERDRQKTLTARVVLCRAFFSLTGPRWKAW